MSNSRRRDETALGVEASPDRPRRMFPLLFIKSRRILGVREGPNPVQYVSQLVHHVDLKLRPLDFGGNRKSWSYSRTPCFMRESFSAFGDSNVIEYPRSMGNPKSA